MAWANRLGAMGIGLIGLLAGAGPAAAAPTRCEGAEAAGAEAPTPVDPYPLNAAGWGPQAAMGLQASRWAEDWTGMRAAGRAPRFKAMPLAGDATLTLSAEARLRLDHHVQGPLKPGDRYRQGLFRGVLGADLRLDPGFRLYGEISTGQVTGRRGSASANFQNTASLQQLFVDVRRQVGAAMVGAMAGRQEFTDGPRQLISLSDGPNLHRSWNGVRVYAHGQRLRVGAFDLSATRQGSGGFDESIQHDERLQGLNASLIVSAGGGPNTYLDPFWMHSRQPNLRIGSQQGLDARDTLGLRLWGRQGGHRFDLTLAHQTGRHGDRDIKAWGLFAVHSLALSGAGWQPRLTAHIDIASGGGAFGTGTLTGFNPLYASSNHLGEGQFLGLSNLLMVAPGLAVSPSSRTKLSLEYGFARRLRDGDAAYAGGLRPYAGTQALQGREIGGLLRIAGSWSLDANASLFLNYEHFEAGDLLQRARLPSGSYAYVGATWRY